MVRRHYSLPSLSALAAFEAAARNGSLTRAAQELNVTPGAVSKHVKALEIEIGGALFVRRHRALEPTREGAFVAAALRDAFTRMSDAVRSAKQSGRSRVTVGSTLAFAHLWLMPRLGKFWDLHQDIVIDHVISDLANGLDRPDIDLRIRYGDGAWPDEKAAKLYDDRIVPVASPAFAREHPVGSAEALAELPLLSTEGPDWTWTTWPSFMREVAGSRGQLNVRHFNSYVIAIQAARSGQGVALGWVSLVHPLIASGDLVRLTDAAMDSPGSFFVTWSAQRPLTNQAETLRNWLFDVEFNSTEATPFFA